VSVIYHLLKTEFSIVLQICLNCHNLYWFKCINVCVVMATGYAKPAHRISHTISPTFVPFLTGGSERIMQYFVFVFMYFVRLSKSA